MCQRCYRALVSTVGQGVLARLGWNVEPQTLQDDSECVSSVYVQHTHNRRPRLMGWCYNDQHVNCGTSERVKLFTCLDNQHILEKVEWSLKHWKMLTTLLPLLELDRENRFNTEEHADGDRSRLTSTGFTMIKKTSVELLSGLYTTLVSDLPMTFVATWYQSMNVR